MREPVDPDPPDIPMEAWPFVCLCLDAARDIKARGGHGELRFQFRDGPAYEPHTWQVSFSKSFQEIKRRFLRQK